MLFCIKQKIMRRYFTLISLVFLGYGFAQELPVPEALQEINNIQRVSNHLYRSGQPTKEDFAVMKANGITTSLNLRNRFKDDKKAAGSGVAIERIRINSFRMTYDHVVQALRIIHANEGAILLHCKHGSDRTGVVSASYRVLMEGWSPEKAMQEFLQPELGFHKFWFPNLKRLLENMDWEQLRKDVMDTAKN